MNDNNNQSERIICTRCKVSLPIEQFTMKRSGLYQKRCNRCNENCRMNSKCEHNRQKNLCKECGGSSICDHNRQKSFCKDCRGSSICEHNRRKNYCKDCRGSSICEHNRRKDLCKECGGSSICEHNRQKNLCKECGGSCICEHNRRKNQCKDCMTDQEKIQYIQKRMITSSRQADKKKNRYDANNFR